MSRKSLFRADALGTDICACELVISADILNAPAMMRSSVDPRAILIGEDFETTTVAEGWLSEEVHSLAEACRRACFAISRGGAVTVDGGPLRLSLDSALGQEATLQAEED